jgi:Na+/H+ antiporter NhaD/arsenite permease-like protein
LIVYWGACGLFVLGLFAIAREHVWHLNKAITASLLGACIWPLIVLSGGREVEQATEVVSAEIFGIVGFLLYAMTIVEYLVHYRFFDWVYARVLRLKLADRAQLWFIGALSFILSAIIDNLTTTLVMLQIATRFFRGRNLLIAACTIITAANAGGAPSPIGDVTTIMLWLHGKFTVGQVIGWGTAPALVMFLLSTALLARHIRSDTPDLQEEPVTISRSEWVVIAVAALAFPLPCVFHLLKLPPYMGLMLGFGLLSGIVAFFNYAAPRQTHLSARMDHLLKRVQHDSLLFFAGILLAVAGLRHLGILSDLSRVAFGEAPGIWRFVAGNTFLGVLSALVDNIPLTAAAVHLLKTTDPAIWVLLAFTVGTGGSFLVFGSAAGVVAMSALPGLTHDVYRKISPVPVAAGYLGGVAVWCLQYLFFR